MSAENPEPHAVDVPVAALHAQRELRVQSAAALPAVRAAAASWAAATGTLFGAAGIAALLAGPGNFAQLPGPWRAISTILFAVGGAAGVLAGLMATWAAQTRFRQTLLSPKSKEQFEKDALSRALGQLQDSRVLAVGGVGAVLASAVILWSVSPVAASNLIQATDQQGDVVCGSVTNEGSVPVLRSGNQSVPLSRLRHFRSAKTCP